MKPVHIPRSFIILILVLVAAIFLAGTMHTFASVHAAPGPTPTAAARGHIKSSTTLTPTPVPTPVLVSADTTGIIALAIVIVVIVLIGTILGGSRPHKTKSS